jgi:hypothetical protein
VWRRVGGVSQVLYAFAGTVDRTALRDVLEQVRRLIDAVPGRWQIECVATEAGRRHVATAVRELHQWRQVRANARRRAARAGQPLRAAATARRNEKAAPAC